MFHTVPKPGETGDKTWEAGSNEYTGNTGVWAPISVDPELGYAYLPGETPADDYYGGARLGSNLFANSVVCLDAETGKMIWYYQISHHDIWNYDLPSAPALVNMTVDGKPVKGLVQLTKQAFAYVLNRETGQPVWPIEERPVPASDVPGEHAWPTQPHPTKPPAYDYQGYKENDLIDFTPELRAEAIQIAKQYRLGPVFTPASEVMPDGTKGSWYNPGGSTGGFVKRAAPSTRRPAISTFRRRPARASSACARIRNRTCGFRAGPAARSGSRACRSSNRPTAASPRSISTRANTHGWSRSATRCSVKDKLALKGVTLPNTGGISTYRGHHARDQDPADRRRRLGRRPRGSCLR